MARTVILRLGSMRPEIERATTDTGFESFRRINDRFCSSKSGGGDGDGSSGVVVVVVAVFGVDGCLCCHRKFAVLPSSKGHETEHLRALKIVVWK